MKSVYSAVRNGPLNKTACASYLRANYSTPDIIVFVFGLCLCTHRDLESEHYGFWSLRVFVLQDTHFEEFGVQWRRHAPFAYSGRLQNLTWFAVGIISYKVEAVQAV